jgi:hypothetical protein
MLVELHGRVEDSEGPAALPRRRRTRVLHNIAMVPGPASPPATHAAAGAATEDEAHLPSRPATLRALLIVAGLVTLATLTLLAAVHLAADISAVRGIRGGWPAFALRLVPVAVLALAGLAVAVLVAWLAGSSRRREVLAIAIGFGALIGLRVILSAQLDSGTGGEPAHYKTITETLLTGPWDFLGRPMGYAFALAPAFAIIDDRQLATEVVNLALGVLAGGVVLGLTRGLYGRRAGALALLGYALWPAGALMTVVSIPQIAFDLLTAAAAWVAVATRPGWPGGTLTGTLLGLSQYVRPTAPFMLPAFILARLWPGGSRRALLGAIAVPILAFLVVLVPVMVYNVARTGSPSISTSDWGGQTLYIGTDVTSGGMYTEAADKALEELAGPVSVLERSAVGTRIALQRIREDPLGIAALAVRKQETLWATEHYGVQYAISNRLRDRPEQPKVTTPMLLSQGFYVLLLASATLGLWLRRRYPDALAPLAISTIWIASAIHALLEVRDRHHSYVVPLLLPFAALALSVAFERVRTWLSGRLNG